MSQRRSLGPILFSEKILYTMLHPISIMTDVPMVILKPTGKKGKKEDGEDDLKDKVMNWEADGTKQDDIDDK